MFGEHFFQANPSNASNRFLPIYRDLSMVVIHVSKNPNVIASEIRKDMFSNCLTFFKFLFPYDPFVTWALTPCGKNSTPKNLRHLRHKLFFGPPFYAWRARGTKRRHSGNFRVLPDAKAPSKEIVGLLGGLSVTCL